MDPDFDYQNDPKRFLSDMSVDAGSYGNPDEKRVMTGVEAQALQNEGLPERTSHLMGQICMASNPSVCYAP